MVDEWMDDEWTDKQVMDGQRDGWVDRWWMGGRLDDGWTDGQMDGHGLYARHVLDMWDLKGNLLWSLLPGVDFLTERTALVGRWLPNRYHPSGCGICAVGVGVLGPG